MPRQCDSSSEASPAPPSAQPGGGGSSGLLDASPGPVLPQALDTLVGAHETAWADPSARHAAGRRSRALLDRAREFLAQGLGVRPDEVTFHASGDQAARSAMALLSRGRRRRPGPVVASAVEHSALLRWLRAGEVPPSLVAVSPTGAVDLAAWRDAIGAQTPFAALQSANQEVGTRQPLAAARAATREHGVPLLVDARAGLGRDAVPTDFDVLVGDATSWGGPRLGVLVVRTGTRVSPHHPPSPHEGGYALDPVDVPTALAAAEAWQQTAAQQQDEGSDARALVDRIRAAAVAIDEVDVVGDPQDRLPHVCTFSVLYVDGETIVDELARRGLAVASGSACTADTLEPSHVLAAMGALTQGNVRVTLPLRAVAPDRADAVERLCGQLDEVVRECRARLLAGP
ncbi:cysteine desulfurase family protein [Janibacter limosus]|uniref:Aminotransferase class V-fold PLP-dependent enzyme n=1 Tax=Janibacter limosus TaxID=53458 RepID=A0A4P6MX69_9MICO|nr:aminotransferase class V-fold PLP-dependent enzyme [Janibacter limosus]QBF46200.1 aminotransferase class V-fold PLP-dependent enzyme [Janibacter limosus]